MNENEFQKIFRKYLFNSLISIIKQYWNTQPNRKNASRLQIKKDDNKLNVLRIVQCALKTHKKISLLIKQ